MTLRVVHLVDGRHFGGAEQMVRRLAAASDRIGVEASVYCLSEGRLSDYLRQGGIPTRIFSSTGRFDFRALGPMTRSLREDRADLLQAHTSRTHLMARLLSRRTALPNITTIQSPIALDENRGQGRHPVRAWVERAGRRWTHQICPVSREETERLIGEEGVAREKITCIPNGVESVDLARLGDPRGDLRPWLERHGQTGDAFVIAMVAALRPRKGADTLVRAFGRYRAEGGKGFLVFIGDDEFTRGTGYLDGLKQMARDVGAGQEIEFIGFMDDPWGLARGADSIALPSLFGEGLPLTLLEAMNHARAIVASDTPGNRECVTPGESGWLHGPGDDVVLADRIAEAASDRARVEEFGRRGREMFLERFELARVLDRWKELYERLTSPMSVGVQELNLD